MVTFESRRRFSSLRRPRTVETSTSSSSRATQTTESCGCPSGSTVASTAYSGAFSSRLASSVITTLITETIWRSSTGRTANLNTWEDRGMWTSVPIDLCYRTPIDIQALWEYWHDRTIAGVEEWQEASYRRAVQLPGGPGIICVHRHGHELSGEAFLTQESDAAAARELLHRTIDAEMVPEAVREGLG